MSLLKKVRMLLREEDVLGFEDRMKPSTWSPGTCYKYILTNQGVFAIDGPWIDFLIINYEDVENLPLRPKISELLNQGYRPGLVYERIELLDEEFPYIQVTYHDLDDFPEPILVWEDMHEDELIYFLSFLERHYSNFIEVTQSLDELFHRSKVLQSSEKYYEFLKFINKFKNYAPYNNMLVYLQNPNTTFYATALDWWRRFNRTIKRGARGMLILSRTPVFIVYDIEDTEGVDPLPSWITNPFEVTGVFLKSHLDKTIQNCERNKIKVIKVNNSSLQAGCVVKYLFKEKKQGDAAESDKVIIEINEQLDDAAVYGTLCHELAHLYLGHLGSDKDKWWPDRNRLSKEQKEIEAESCSYLVCDRLGLKTKSDEYLVGYATNPQDLQGISVELIAKVSGHIEKMSRETIPLRKLRS